MSVAADTEAAVMLAVHLGPDRLVAPLSDRYRAAALADSAKDSAVE